MRVRPIRLLRDAVAGACLVLALSITARAAPSEEPLAVVVPASAAHHPIDASELAAIYRRKRRFWPDGTAIEPVNLGAADIRRRHFSRVVTGLLPEAMEDYWDEQYFQGILPPRVLASPEAVLRFVTDTRGAIGYVPLCSVDRRVAVIAVVTDTVTVTETPNTAACRH
jgi:hypothetical protein